MYTCIQGAAVYGLDGYLVSVEVDISRGLPCFEIVGLPMASVKEAKERVRAAIKNSGYEFPLARIVVNLAPADVRKDSSGLDLPIAIGIIAASKQWKSDAVNIDTISNEMVFIGELSLKGEIHGITGVIAMAIAASEKDKKVIFLSEENGLEGASSFTGKVFGAQTLAELLAVLEEREPPNWIVSEDEGADTERMPDLADVQGQVVAKKALEVAAAGFHHLLLMGPPGAGKSMMASRLPSILPPLTKKEQLEISKIYSIAGLLTGGGLQKNRPFRNPHHTITLAGMVGGGQVPKPGEITLSHGGVLFLDEAPEFSRAVLEVLRQPLEEGCVHISRGGGTYTYPCKHILIMAKNPCPCGWYGSEDQHPCTCTAGDIYRYNHKISGPLLDRIDMVITVKRPTYDELSKTGEAESSTMIRQRVIKARIRQAKRMERFGIMDISCNGEMSHPQIRDICQISKEGRKLLKEVFENLRLSARSHDRIIRVAQTIADLQESNYIEIEHIAEAISYRQ